jgi:hypothetical protein
MRTRMLILATALLGPIAAVGLTTSGAAASSPPTWKFPASINAAWAHGDNESDNDTPAAAVGLCRSAPFNTLGAYAPTSDIDAIVGDPVNNSGASNFGCQTPQNETAIAVDPSNANHIVAGANDYRVCCDFTGLNDGTGWAYVSNDGGTNWTNVQVPGLTDHTGGQGNFKKVDSAGDPAMAIGPDGTVYYANIVFSRVSPASGVAVSVSHDGGLTWDAPSMVAYNKAGNFFNDKELIAAGPDGRVVVTWTRFDSGPHGASYLSSPIVMSLSRDHGQTWSVRTPVSDASHPFDQGSYPQYATDGTLYVAYEGGTPSTGYATDVTLVARSTNDGATFTNVEVGRVYDDLDCYPIFGGRQTLTGEHFRLNSYPGFGVDPVTGGLAITWADDQGAGNCGTGQATFSGTTAAQVKLVSGAWGSLSAPAVVTTGTADKVFPAVAARAGTIAVSYYTRDYAATHNPATCNVAILSEAAGDQSGPVANSVCLDYAARVSTDGFATQSRLTSEGSNPYIQFANGSFIGDYTQMGIGSDGVAHTAWTDFRGRPGTTPANQDVYVASFAM